MILITGGNGYIGENLQERYKEKVRFASCDYDTDLPLAQDLSFHDIKGNYNAIVHLSALSGIVACETNPMEAVEKNLLTSMNIFQLALKARIPVVFTSSQAAKEPKSSTYAFMKWSIEQMAGYYNKAGGSNYVLRLSNVYGGIKYLEKKQTCIKQFITRYREDKPLLIHGDGKQTRDFVHVDDVCDAIMNTIAFRPVYGKPIDIGTGKQFSIMEVQEMFRRKKHHHYDFTEARAGAKSSIADVSIAKEIINFTAIKNLKDYIQEMIEDVD